MGESHNDDAIRGRWALLLQGREGLIVKPYLIEAEAGKVEMQFVFGSGGQLVTGESYSLHDTLDDAIETLRAARDGARVEGSLVVHSEGELQFATDGFRM